MADFSKAYDITIYGNEGGYDPGVDENETYRGIDRGENPGWNGWQIIDVYKRDYPLASVAKMNVLLNGNNILQQKIVSFYKANYWDAVNLDKVNNQQLANNLFGCSVNQGSGLACRFMQHACNTVINQAQSALAPLAIDLQIGPATLNAFNQLPADQLNAAINTEREASYRKDAGFAQWGQVWLKRLKNYA